MGRRPISKNKREAEASRKQHTAKAGRQNISLLIYYSTSPKTRRLLKASTVVMFCTSFTILYADVIGIFLLS